MGGIKFNLLQLVWLTSPLLALVKSEVISSLSSLQHQVKDGSNIEHISNEGRRNLVIFGDLLPNDEGGLFEEQSGQGEATVTGTSTSPTVVASSPPTEAPVVGYGPVEEGNTTEFTEAFPAEEVSTTDDDDYYDLVESGTGILGETPAPSSAPMEGDFENLNRLLRNTVITLGDADISESLLFQPLTIQMRNLECTQVRFEDITLSSENRTDEWVNIEFSILNLGIQCDFDFAWSYIFLNGNGHALVNVGDSSVNAAMKMRSEDFQTSPPVNATIEKCQTDINILGLDFSGNVASQIFNLFEDTIISVLDDLLDEKICTEFKGIGSDLLGEALSLGFGVIEPYLEPAELWRYNISYPELTMEVPSDVNLISWMDEDGIGDFFSAALDEIDNQMGSLKEDDNTPSETALVFPNGTEYPEGFDLGINSFVRKYLLDEERVYSMEEDIVFYEGHDALTETTLTLKALRVRGLDTFTNFEPFTRIGNFTLQNAVSFEFLAFEAVIEMEIKASSTPDSIIRDAERVVPYVEEMKFDIGVDDLETIISIMVAIDPAKVAALKIGSVLDLMSLLPCAATSLHDFALAGVDISIGDIRMPTIEGLVSKGVDRLLIDALDLGFYMYKGTILQAIPTMFQSIVRDLIAEFIADISCPDFIVPVDDQLVDLRDLLLDTNEAVEAGATGLVPYGDLAATIYGIGQSMWQEVEVDGTLGLNDLLIKPITQSTSNRSGLLNMPGDLFNFTTDDNKPTTFKSLVKRFEFAIYDLKIENLDTVVHPMAVIQPVNHPYITQSTINMGPLEDRPLSVSVTMLMALDIEDSPLAMNNIFSMGFSVGSIELFFEIMTMLSAADFLNFEIGNGFNFECLMATMPPPELNETGYAIDTGVDQGVKVRKLLARISELELTMDCLECSPGLASLPDMVDIFDRTKVTDIWSYRIPLFLEEIAISDALHTRFDRWLVEAPYYCPHNMEFDLDFEYPEEWETPEFSELSVEASDSIFFTAFTLAEMALVLVTETHYPWNLSSLEPLSSQELFVADEGSEIIDWTQLSETFNSLANSTREYLGENSTDKQTNITDLGINQLIRDFLTEEDGTIDVVGLLGGESFEFSIEGIVVFIHSMTITGLDSFTRFDALKPIAPQTILNSMHLDHLGIEVTVSTGSRTDPAQYITAKLNFEDLNATLPFFAAFDKTKFDLLEFGHFMFSPSIFPCALSLAEIINFPQILMTIGNFTVPTFEGFLPDSGQALKDSMAEVYDRYAVRALKALPILFDASARSFVNSFIANYIATAKCTHIKEHNRNNTPSFLEPYPFTDYVDFRELVLPAEEAGDYGARGNGTYGDLIQGLITPLRDELLWVDPSTNLSSLNSLIRAGTSLLFDEEGTISLPGDVAAPIQFLAEIGALVANITFSIGDLKVRNLDTIGDPLTFLRPVAENPSKIENSLGAGLGGKPLRFSMRLSLNVLMKNDIGEVDQDVRNDMIIEMNMVEFKALFAVVARLSEDRLVHFPMEDILNPSCWASLMPAPRLDERGIRLAGEESSLVFKDIVVAVEELGMTIKCSSCSSPGMEGLVNALAKNESKPVITSAANSLFGFGGDLANGRYLQDLLDRLLSEAGRQCPHDARYDPDAASVVYKPLDFDRKGTTSSLLIMLITVGFSLLISMLVLAIVVKWIVNRRHQRWIRTLPAMKVHILKHQQEADDQMEKELNQDTLSLFGAEEIPKRVRYGMPLLILGNIAFFVSGHFSIAAETAFEAQVAGEKFTLDRFFAFSIMKSTVDMWEAGAIEMAIFILVFSGIWPYTKQIISLICWFAPPSKLSISTRGSTFMWLDTLAKWSMVDIFVMFVSMVSFRVQAVTPNVPFLPPDFFSLSLILIPRWGLYANLIAQLISQVSSHFIIHYHRAVVRRASRKYARRHASQMDVEKTLLVELPAEDSDMTVDAKIDDAEQDANPDYVEQEIDEQNRLCDGAFARPHNGESSKLVARQIASYGLVMVTFILIVFFIIGSSLPSISVQIQGAISFVSAAGLGVYQEFSVFGISKRLMTDGLELGGYQVAGYLLLIIVFVSTVFIVPILQGLAHAYHWFKPMNDNERKTFSTIVEILGAWQYAEVFILALVVASWQLAPTSETIMSKQCAEFESFFEMLAYYNVLENQDSHCFRVEATVMNGTYFLFCGAILLSISQSFVMKASYQYYWDKECCRKEMATKDHLSPAEAATPVDEIVFKGVHPPPVLFTDSFRWLLRKEHLGDRPAQGIVIEEQSQESTNNSPENLDENLD